MSSDFAISVSGTSKHYMIYSRPEDRLKQMIAPKVQKLFGQPPKKYYAEFVAVRDMSFDIGRGETVGIIGRNGSGKSTLLQMICGTLHPSSGSIRVNGRIAALLELGSGFNPEFTGRENVFLNASILGLTQKETEARFAEIEKFADIGKFIDRPVKTYSSGMYVRLAFAVAINVDPDILVVDEALAVGDEAFQRKCFARIEDIRARGATILFVSHSAQSIIQLCDKAILLDAGEKLLEGSPKMVVNQYQRLINLPAEEVAEARERIRKMDGWAEPTTAAEDSKTAGQIVNGSAEADPIRKTPVEPDQPPAWFDPEFVSVSVVTYQPQGATISDITLLTEDGEPVNHLLPGETYIYSYQVVFDSDVEKASFAMLIKTVKGIEIAGQSSHSLGKGETFAANERVEVSFRFTCNFLPGAYLCNCGVYTNAGGDFRQLHRVLDATIFRVMPSGAELKRIGLVDIAPGIEGYALKRLPDPGFQQQAATPLESRAK
ncbi:MAG: ABC transporter ATP-binding protein [Hyphomonas sp.]|uniref:ABC transporter ATP-binding protein n=1 Tax=Hyphomonas sp. TaxID=87 RepID=UPI0035270CDA